MLLLQECAQELRVDVDFRRWRRTNHEFSPSSLAA
jgi:hypothetical protein